MQELPAFGEQLMRLADIRGLRLGVLAHQASVPDAEITSVLDGADLNTLTGIDLPRAGPPHHPDTAEAADLIWNARRLTTSQLRQVRDRAHTIRHERAEELDPPTPVQLPRTPMKPKSDA